MATKNSPLSLNVLPCTPLKRWRYAALCSSTKWARGMPTSLILSAQRFAGFTLIELMIAVAVVGILSAIAYPSYADYIKRGRIADALSPLSQFRLQMEHASQDNGNYGTGTCAVTLPSNTSYFTFNCALSGGGQGFTATAVGSSAMTGYSYTVDQAGAQKTTAYPKRSSLPAACWLTRPGDC
jgi:type IV pilus assembly protein PilE